MSVHHSRWTTCIAACCVLAASSSRADELTPEQLQFFEQQVRPVLVKRCYECHSKEAQTLEGGLRLDSREGWETGGDSGSAIEPGNVAGSLLITAIRYDGLEMPPDGKLPDEEVAILERWVEMGAPDPRVAPESENGFSREIDFAAARGHWPFRHPERHEAPQVSRAGWPKDALDRFVLAKIEAAGLTPAADADWRTWLRRVTFDLTGLPPTPEEVAAFLEAMAPAPGDSGAAAHEQGARARVVDRLLASPAFGEHWGRHWLDVARYADTNGGDFNATFKSAWQYRDYVIAALNSDKPFDEFIREQLAGDLLPFDTDAERAEQLMATGFLMVGCKMLSERDKEKFRMDVVDEQVDTVGRAFLGLTLGCARCHDHKFDPVPTADYYALAGIFQSTESYRGESQKYVSTWKEVDLPVAPSLIAAVEEHRRRTEELRASIKQLESRQKAAGDQLRSLDPDLEGIIVDDLQAELAGEWKKSTNTPRYFGEGYIHNDKQELGDKSVTFRPVLPAAGTYEVRMSFAASGGRATNVPVVITHADGEQRLAVDETKMPPLNDLWLPLGHFHFEAGTTGTVTVRTEDTDGYVLADAMQFLPLETPAEGERPETIDPQVAELRERVSELTEQIETTRKSLQEHEAAAPPPIPTCMAVREHEEMGDAAVRIRGEVHREGEIVPRGFLTVLSDAARRQLQDTSQSGRRELAEWIASSDNPLTGRVIVNRVWHHLFGRGIVASVDNFGQLGERPTHPELLDTLTVEFIEDGWSLKRLIRRLVLSRSYGLSSAGTVSDVDPQNDLLAHARRRRLPAESLRDAMLSVSGLLDRTAGGSSVEPLAYLAIATTGEKSADLEVEENVRRSVYLPMVRNDLPEFLRLFDMADPELVTGRRPVTNVPAQALYLLNSPFVERAAAATASRIASLSDAMDRRIDLAYEFLLSRPAIATERERAVSFLSAGGPAAEESWTRFVHLLLASTEFQILD